MIKILVSLWIAAWFIMSFQLFIHYSLNYLRKVSYKKHTCIMNDNSVIC